MNHEEQLAQQEQHLWESWLEKEWGRKLNAIRDNVVRLYNENEAEYAPLEHFIPHGPDHSKSVENKVHELIPGREHEKLSQREKFCLLAAAWLHDVGMMRSVAKSVYGRELSADEIRRLHHRTSEEYVVNHWKRLGIDEMDREVIGKLCRYHRRIEDINELHHGSMVGDSPLRLRLLASYLRLADSLDTTPSRAPAEPYAVCLAYGIPPEAKLHWIKNRLVLGIMPNAVDHTIKIQFKIPYTDQLGRIGSSEAAISKLDSLRKSVVNDLREELSSVVNVIAKGQLSYYLDVVEEEPLPVSFTQSMLNDLRGMVLYDDIMGAPSASKLLEIILVTVAALIGFSLQKDEAPVLLDETGDKNIPEVRRGVGAFLDEIERKIVAERPCHLGLQKLIEECKSPSERLVDEDSLQALVDWVNSRFQEHHRARREVRKNSKILIENELPHLMHQKRGINILLYGYSELVTKAICGLRDALISTKSDSLPKDMYNSKIELWASKKIHIFICEGQPKTKTGYGNQLDYHDGAQYALHLEERGFTQIGIIPDILVGTIIARTPIDCIFLGANGVTPKEFLHCAGHLAIVEIARGCEDQRKPSIILVTSKEKVVENPEDAPTSYRDQRTDQPQEFRVNLQEVDGSWFGNLPDHPLNRTHIWMCRDRRLLDLLHEKNIFFANPREDRIPIAKVNYIVSDVGHYRVTPENSDHVIKQLFFPTASGDRL